jgi:hypothetical protein
MALVWRPGACPSLAPKTFKVEIDLAPWVMQRWRMQVSLFLIAVARANQFHQPPPPAGFCLSATLTYSLLHEPVYNAQLMQCETYRTCVVLRRTRLASAAAGARRQ